VCLLALALAALSAGTRAATTFLAGADLSLLAWFESQGVAYRTNGGAGDALALLKSQGVNCVRLRLFTSSATQAAADPYDYENNLAYTIPLAVRVKTAGLQFLLDFHYSDTWADPGHQAVPPTWAPADLASLTNQVRAYNSNCLAAFRAAGTPPDFVQIGNAITGGRLWPGVPCRPRMPLSNGGSSASC